MTGDPRIPKPLRLPISYTDEQISFLRSHLAEFERRSQGTVRGDAKKFALERAGDFITRFGQTDFHGEESEARFREQIYNWFKNTSGRTRRKLEGKPRSAKKAAEKAANNNVGTTSISMSWNTNVATPTVLQYQQGSTHNNLGSPSPSISPIQYGGMQPSSSSLAAATSPVMSSPPPLPTPSSPTQNASMNLNLNISSTNLRDAFLTPTIPPPNLASMIQTYVITNPSQTPLTPVIHSLFDAIRLAESQLSPQSSYNAPDPYPTLLRRFLDSSAYFSPSVVHAGVSGPLAGPRALQMQIHKHATWCPNATPSSTIVPPRQRANPPQSLASSSMSDEMQRIAADRQRRRDHIQWARIHSAALELGMMGMGHSGEPDNTGYAYAMGRAFSVMVARDAVWEPDEVEWVAGICVLRAVIRTAMRGNRSQKEEYDELLRTYESRWREIKDEARQALVTDVLLGAKDDLARLDEPHMS